MGRAVARTGEDSRLTVSYQIFLTIACLLAAIGAITDSPVTVVGAMVLGPEFGPLAAVAVGLVLRRGDLIARGAIALAVGFPLAMAVTAAAPVIFDLTGLLTAGALDRLDDVEFIYQVGPFSFIIAVLAGVAGMLAITSAKSASLVGVFISVTTVPAAAFASVAIVEHRLDEALSSALQLVVNLVGIVIAAALGLLTAQHTRRRRHVAGPPADADPALVIGFEVRARRAPPPDGVGAPFLRLADLVVSVRVGDAVAVVVDGLLLADRAVVAVADAQERRRRAGRRRTRAEQHADLDVVVAVAAGAEGELADQQGHGEPDSGEQGEPEDVPPAQFLVRVGRG